MMDTKIKNQVIEAFNTVRTNIGFLSVDRDLKVIMIISSIKGEGKTTATANLANSLIANDNKVLIIDADLRNPSVHRMFSIANRKGLSDLICERLDDNRVQQYDCIYHHNASIDILTAGHKPPNPTELLGSNRIKLILDNLRKCYDYIIIDSPPVLVIPDALALSKYVDGVLLIARYGYTTKDILENAKRTLELANIKPIGCIFNAVENIKKKYSYYEYEEVEPTKATPKLSRSYQNSFTKKQTHKA